MGGDDEGTGDGTAASDRTDDAEDSAGAVLTLPEDARDAFKDPFGPLYTDVETLVANHDAPFLTVGDIVTYHFREAGRSPAVAFVDGRTQRETAPDDVRATLDDLENRVAVENPPGTITAALLEAIVEAVEAGSPTTIVVDGEEDLAAVPAVLAAPDGATVVYGQPEQGMVAVSVTDEHRSAFRELLGAFDGDQERALALLGAAD